MMSMKKSEDIHTVNLEKDVKNEKKGTYKEWVDEDYWRKYGEGGKNRWVDKE
jgi:hypothetical protein|tara:strand:+ start:1737 stop:1892 length:156 start_codon:yes stop_codon:yes gene_type:complete